MDERGSSTLGSIGFLSFDFSITATIVSPYFGSISSIVESGSNTRP